MKNKNIKILAMDVDGTLTDGKIYISNDGQESKAFNVKDGLAIKKIYEEYNVIPVIITGRYSKIVEIRASELGITEIYQGIHNKRKILEFLCQKYNISLENVAYIGDDINDLDAIRISGLSFAPLDCANDIKEFVDIILTTNGGEGAVRECISYLLKHQLV